MGILVSGMVVITLLLLASAVMFGTFLTNAVTGAQSLKDLTQVHTQRSGSALNITSAVFDGAGARDMGVLVDNTGSQSVPRFEEMDLIVDYSDAADTAVLTHLEYTAAAIGSNQWTVPSTGVQPDSFNPGIWDSDEILFIDLQLDPQVKSGTAALVVVSTPWGVSDQTSATAP